MSNLTKIEEEKLIEKNRLIEIFNNNNTLLDEIRKEQWRIETSIKNVLKGCCFYCGGKMSVLIIKKCTFCGQTEVDNASLESKFLEVDKLNN
jgi:hypothetical protein